jgi:hypothetical protein
MKEMQCGTCAKKFNEGVFCPNCGTKLTKIITSTVQFKKIHCKRHPEKLKSDIRRWLERIGVTEVKIVTSTTRALVSYSVAGIEYHFESTRQQTLQQSKTTKIKPNQP